MGERADGGHGSLFILQGCPEHLAVQCQSRRLHALVAEPLIDDPHQLFLVNAANRPPEGAIFRCLVAFRPGPPPCSQSRQLRLREVGGELRTLP